MLRQRDGHLTRDLVRTPGGFGLGQVPARHKPDATADLGVGSSPIAERDRDLACPYLVAVAGGELHVVG